MAGLEADTSSYNQPLPVGPLDVATKVQQFESQGITIDKQKLDLINTQFGLMNKELSILASDPSITKEKAAERLNTFAKTYKFPAEVANHMTAELNSAPNVETFAKTALKRGLDNQAFINNTYGQGATQNDNKFSRSGVQTGPLSAAPGAFVPQTQTPVQIAPGTPGYNSENQQVFEQPAGASGVVPVPRPRPDISAIQPKRMPVERISGPTGPTVETTGSPNQQVAERFPEPLKAGPSPMFPEGKEAYTKDQLNASARSLAIKPAIQALKLMPGLSTGPGTAQFNDLVAAAKAWGVLDTKAENDPTVLRQEIDKKMAQYVGNSPIGQRSDAQQALAEAGSPNPKKQISQALQSLTRDAIALDRVNILKPQAFTGTDYQNYIKHSGTFPAGIDEKALTLDMLPEKERETLVKKMASDYKNGDAKAKAKADKFFTTLTLAKKHNIYEAGSE